MYVGPVTGLLIAKGFGLLLMVAAIALANRRIFVWLNFWLGMPGTPLKVATPA
jgi:hypothetical protein